MLGVNWRGLPPEAEAQLRAAARSQLAVRKFYVECYGAFLRGRRYCFYGFVLL